MEALTVGPWPHGAARHPNLAGDRLDIGPTTSTRPERCVDGYALVATSRLGAGEMLERGIRRSLTEFDCDGWWGTPRPGSSGITHLPPGATDPAPTPACVTHVPGTSSCAGHHPDAGRSRAIADPQHPVAGGVSDTTSTTEEGQESPPSEGSCKGRASNNVQPGSRMTSSPTATVPASITVA